MNNSERDKTGYKTDQRQYKDNFQNKCVNTRTELISFKVKITEGQKRNEVRVSELVVQCVYVVRFLLELTVLRFHFRNYGTPLVPFSVEKPIRLGRIFVSHTPTPSTTATIPLKLRV